MNKMIKKIGFAFLALLTTNTAFSQEDSGIIKAKYNNWAYAEAYELGDEVSDPTTLKQVGDSYFFNGKYEKAYAKYNQLFSFEDVEVEDIYFFRYAQSLKNVGQDDKADEFFKLYKERLGSASQFAKINKDISRIKEDLKNNSGRYSKIINLPINSSSSDYGSFLKDNALYFATNRDTGSFFKRIHSWTGHQFSDIYEATIDNRGMRADKMNEVSHSQSNQSTAIITKDGQTMYFTGNNVLDWDRQYSENEETLLKIYKAELVDGLWSNIVELPFNSNEFNTAHPTLSVDEEYLYFASDRPGGYGASDLWKIRVLDNGNFADLQNLGADVNTEARETFPFISSDNKMYFSTDGRIGFGALDTYVADIDSSGNLLEIHNIGAPINSPYDDFAYYIEADSRNGFFSSNRKGGKGSDDIYTFSEQRPLKPACSPDVKFVVLDSYTNEPIDNADLLLSDTDNVQLGYTTSETNEYVFNYDFSCGDQDKVIASKEGYLIGKKSFSVPESNGLTIITLSLDPVVQIAETPKIVPVKGADLYKVLELNPIYFDFDKSNIRPDAAYELSKIVAFMKEYSDVVIEVRSHTDVRGSNAYNLKLSDRRAKSTADWIIANNISAGRVKYKGYGETEIANHCKVSVKCSDAEHERNRRSQFIILELN